MAQRFYGVTAHPDASKNGVYTTWDECSAVVKGAKGVRYKGFGSREEAEAFCCPPEEEKAASAVEAAVTAKPNTPFDPAMANQYISYLAQHGILTPQAAMSARSRADSYYDAPRSDTAGTRAQAKSSAYPDPTRMAIDVPDGVTMYVDGSYNARSQQCGFGIYIQGAGRDTRGRGPEAVLYGSVPHANNGRNVEGEVTAAWVGLQQVTQMVPTGTPITIYHDYEGVGKWADSQWKANLSYTRAYAEMVKELRQQGHDIRFAHVDGHTGVEGNEVVDRLAKMGCGIAFPEQAKFRSEFSGVPGFAAPVPLDTPVHEAAPQAIQLQSQDDGLSL